MTGRARRILAPMGLAACLMAVPAIAAEEAVDRVAVDQEAPEIVLPDVGGETHTLSALEGEKNAVLVFYRGGW